MSWLNSQMKQKEMLTKNNSNKNSLKIKNNCSEKSTNTTVCISTDNKEIIDNSNENNLHIKKNRYIHGHMDISNKKENERKNKDGCWNCITSLFCPGSNKNKIKKHSRLGKKYIYSKICESDSNYTYKSEQYRLWAMFLAGLEIDTIMLLQNISNMPFQIRVGVWMHCINQQKCKNQDVLGVKKQSNTVSSLKNFNITDNIIIEEALKNDGSIIDSILNDSSVEESSITNSGCSTIDFNEKSLDDLANEINIDTDYIKKIFEQCQKIGYKDPKCIFDIFKLIKKKFSIDDLFLNVLLIFTELPGINSYKMKNIVSSLINNHGIIEVFYKDVENKDFELNKLKYNSFIIEENNNEGKKYEIYKKGDNKNVDNKNVVDKNVDNKNVVKNLNNPECQNEKYINYDVDDETLKNIFNVLIIAKMDVFIHITDLAFCLNCTFRDIINRAAHVSQYTKADEIISVISARTNDHYYNVLCNINNDRHLVNKLNDYKNYEYFDVESEYHSKESYFDFVVIQTELIRAQENIKKQLNDKINELKIENEKLKQNTQNID